MLDAAEFIYKNHKPLNGRLKYSQILSLLDKFENNVIIVRNGDEIKGVAVYFMTDDMTIKRIKSFVHKLNNPEHIKEILLRKGKNLHFFGVVAVDLKTILKGLRMVIEKERPKTISWFKPNMTDFRIVRGEI